jgi:hypothetical protein
MLVHSLPSKLPAVARLRVCRLRWVNAGWWGPKHANGQPWFLLEASLAIGTLADLALPTSILHIHSSTCRFCTNTGRSDSKLRHGIV